MNKAETKWLSRRLIATTIVLLMALFLLALLKISGKFDGNPGLPLMSLGAIWVIGIFQLVNLLLFYSFSPGLLQRFAIVMWFGIQAFGVFGVSIILVSGLGEEPNVSDVPFVLLTTLMAEVGYWYGTYRLLHQSLKDDVTVRPDIENGAET